MGLNKAKIGLFSPSANSAALPGTGQSPPRGPVPDGTPTFDSKDFPTDDVKSAQTVQDLQAQVARLILVFQDAEGREPSPRGDPEFWSAYNTLVQRFYEGYEKQGYEAASNG